MGCYRTDRSAARGDLAAPRAHWAVVILMPRDRRFRDAHGVHAKAAGPWRIGRRRRRSGFVSTRDRHLGAFAIMSDEFPGHHIASNAADDGAASRAADSEAGTCAKFRQPENYEVGDATRKKLLCIILRSSPTQGE